MSRWVVSVLGALILAMASVGCKPAARPDVATIKTDSYPRRVGPGDSFPSRDSYDPYGTLSQRADGSLQWCDVDPQGHLVRYVQGADGQWTNTPIERGESVPTIFRSANDQSDHPGNVTIADDGSASW